MTRRPWVVLLCALGVPVGLGIFTFFYARGYSYLSANPAVCINCHVMNDQYDAWLKSGHRHSTVCIDCHLPHSGAAKWIAKADQGFRHSLAFTLQNYQEPLQITPADRQIVQDNCLRCHGSIVHELVNRETMDCLRCHSNAGH